MLLGNTTLVGADEVAGVAVPTRRGRPSLAVAILAGTVVHFVAFDAGLIALVRPLLIDAAPRTIHLLGAAMVPALCLILIRERGRLDRPAGPALLAL
jgi:Ca2+/Na+ antiporter